MSVGTLARKKDELNGGWDSRMIDGGKKIAGGEKNDGKAQQLVSKTNCCEPNY